MISTTNSPQFSLLKTCHQYTHPSIRDLAWLIISPRVYDCPLGQFTPFTMHSNTDKSLKWLNQLDSSLQLPKYNLPLRAEFKRLGLYSEALFKFWLRQGYDDELHEFQYVDSRVQIFQDSHTLGELDYIVKYRGSTIHIEIANKYYLLRDDCEQPEVWQNWIGPNAQDRLDKKLTHLRTHQLPLGQSTGLEVEVTQSKFSLFGRLFVPYLNLRGSVAVTPTSHPASCNPLSVTGFWLKKNQLNKLGELRGSSWVILDRLEWMTAVTEEEFSHRKLGFDSFNKEVNKRPFPVQAVYSIKRENKCVYQFLMVVNENWPADQNSDAISTPSFKI